MQRCIPETLLEIVGFTIGFGHSLRRRGHLYAGLCELYGISFGVNTTSYSSRSVTRNPEILSLNAQKIPNFPNLAAWRDEHVLIFLLSRNISIWLQVFYPNPPAPICLCGHKSVKLCKPLHSTNQCNGTTLSQCKES